jgi:phosphoribosyl 1,2-cyclic phosphate phosphodiesterase
MELVFLGTGTSQGVPMIAFDEHACDLGDPRNWRMRTSAHVVMGRHRIQLDAGPEFRLQCIQNRISDIDLLVLTHEHADHIMGMDDLRRFCDRRNGAPIPIYSTPNGLRRIAEIYPYAVRDRPLYRGYPAFDLHPMPPRLDLEDGTIESCLLPHGRFDVLGLVFTETATGKRLAYYTDCGAVGPDARRLAEAVDVLVIDGLRREPHPTHLTVDQAVEVGHAIGARRSFLTHITHCVDHATLLRELPGDVQPAYDGLRLTI